MSSLLGRRRFLLAAGSALVAAPLVMRRARATTIFRPEDPPWNAVGDGVADDAGPIQAMTAAMISNGGGVVEMKPKAIYNVFSSGQVTQSVLMNLYGQRGVTIRGNGAQISVGRTWGVSDVLYALLVQNCSDLIVDDLWVTQKNPVALPTTGSGTQVIMPMSGCKDIILNNPSCEGCIALVSSGLVYGLIINNGRATNSVYGVCIVDNEPASFSENSQISLETIGCQRALFIRGAKNIVADVTDIDTISNAYLVTATSPGATVENLTLRCRTKARTSPFYPTGQVLFIGLGSSGSGTMDAVFRNLDITINHDMKGFPSINPAVIIDKTATAARNLQLENFSLRGSIRNIPALPGPVLDLSPAATAPWGGERFRGVKVSDMLLDALGAGASLHADCAPFTADSPLALRDISAPAIAAVVANQATGKLLTSNNHFLSGP